MWGRTELEVVLGVAHRGRKKSENSSSCCTSSPHTTHTYACLHLQGRRLPREEESGSEKNVKAEFASYQQSIVAETLDTRQHNVDEFRVCSKPISYRSTCTYVSLINPRARGFAGVAGASQIRTRQSLGLPMTTCMPFLRTKHNSTVRRQNGTDRHADFYATKITSHHTLADKVDVPCLGYTTSLPSLSFGDTQDETPPTVAIGTASGFSTPSSYDEREKAAGSKISKAPEVEQYLFYTTKAKASTQYTMKRGAAREAKLSSVRCIRRQTDALTLEMIHGCLRADSLSLSTRRQTYHTSLNSSTSEGLPNKLSACPA